MKIPLFIRLAVLGAAFFALHKADAAAPVFDATIGSQTIPCGKTLVVPVIASDADNNPLSYSVTSDNANIMARVKTGNPSLVMHVQYAGTSTPGTAPVITLNFSNWDGNSTSVSITGPNSYSDSISIPAGTAGTAPSFSNPTGWTSTQNGNVVKLTYGSTGSGYGVSTNAVGLTATIQDGTNSTTGVGAFAGDLVFLLFNDLVPRTSEIIEGLAQGGFYNSLTFHRIVQNFVIQGGDPLGNGQGGPGFHFDNEFHPGLIFAGNGQLAMANSGYDTQSASPTYEATNGSQFFITFGQQRFLDFNHTIFGQLIRGFDVLNKLGAVPLAINPATGQPEVDANGNPTNRPAVAPVIVSAKVLPDTADAVLYLSATSNVAAQVTVSISDGKTPGPVQQTFTATGVADTTNDPPFIMPVGDLTTPSNKAVTLKAKAVDLEFDYTSFTSVAATSTTNVTIGGFNPFTITPKGNYSGAFDFALAVEQLQATSRGSVSIPFDISAATLGVGDTSISAASSPFAAPFIQGTGAVLSNQPVATFTVAGRGATAGNYTASINWGDGKASTAITPGTVAADTRAGSFKVTGSHTYAGPGTYPVTVSITGPKGAIASVTSSACIEQEPIIAQGVTITSRGSVRGTVATFNRVGALGMGAAGDYTASINWGDGVAMPGTIVANRGGTGFSVTGSHIYIDNEAFTICVTITDKSQNSATVSSTAQVSGVRGQHFPPFAQTHLVAGWVTTIKQESTGSGATLQRFLHGSFVVVNSGNKNSAPATAKLYLSTDQTLDAQDTLLNVKPTGTATTISIRGLTPNYGQEFDFVPGARDTRIPVPAGVDATGKYVLIQLIYSDPLGDLESIGKVFYSAPVQ